MRSKGEIIDIAEQAMSYIGSAMDLLDEIRGGEDGDRYVDPEYDDGDSILEQAMELFNTIIMNAEELEDEEEDDQS